MKISSILKAIGRLHLGLYLIFLLSIAFSSGAVFFFEQYSLIDLDLFRTEWQQVVDSHKAGEEQHRISKDTWLRIFRPVSVDMTTRNEAKPAGGVHAQAKTDTDSDDLYLLFLLIWLWPLYKYYFSKKPQDMARIERRITGLPMAIFVLGWVMAALRFAHNYFAYHMLYGPVPGRLVLVFAVSSLLFGVLISYLNLEITGLYIRSYIARPFFMANNPYGLKKGFAAGLGMRNALMIFSLATMPLLFMLYIPVFANRDLFIRLAQVRGQASGWEWIFEYDTLRIFIPIILMTVLAALNLGFQAVSIFLYRRNIQAPVNALVKRMKAVASGDFDCKTSVLYGDELGQLKGHFNMMLDGLVERDKIKDTFGRYVSMEIAEKIMKSGKVNLAGEEIQATVLFSDIRDFTPLSEKMPAPELIRFLNDYFAHITEPIMQNRGVINKFIGDAVMAIFSPVFGVEDHKEAALRAALGMREALAKFNAQDKHPEVNFGVGIHSGGLVAGNVGTESRLEYTVLGDTVNVASRIETQTKAAGTQILISRAVMDGVKKEHFPGVNFIECEPVVMKGKSRSMVLYKAEPA